MDSWMTVLSQHFEKTERLYPDDMLMILFDIDGTIIDMRYLIYHVLQKFDEVHDTNHFEELKPTDVNVHENQVERLLDQMGIPDPERTRIMGYWLDHRWQTSSLMESHRPFSGVMEIIRWFQMQPNVRVGLNTGRPEHLREDTLRSLNALGRDYKVSFTSEFLHMNSGKWEEGVAASKIEGIRRFQSAGYRVFAMVDNEPANLLAVYELDECQEILPLHAHTIFESNCADLPYCSASGSDYVLSELASEDDLPSDVQFVWHGVNDRGNLRQFLGSDVAWGEIDVRRDPQTDRLVLHHDPLYFHPETEQTLDLEDAIARFNRFDKSIKLDFKEGGAAVDRVLAILNGESVDGSRLWFNGNEEVLEEEGYRKLRQAYPSAIVQCPIDALVERIPDNPDGVRDWLQTLQDWGVNRFSIKWNAPEIEHLLDQLSDWGFESNVYDVPDRDAFLKTVLLKPRSITADFNFPEWHYFGRGAGQHGEYYNYSAEESAPQTR